ncbi:hypothetical protein Cgig2_024751 [Carnegiea gigantea]|uniref:Uncharacterized protein n=1 Tax=Carnegiea gigantea TaxID=171969 RepID=A0A9Q1K1A3_9CARY|nr:hypothetical protein Cgig2_024751 [Carnegiea gigantea]
MGFPYSLKTDEMALYVIEKFKWYHRGVAFPSVPLPSDYKDLCPDCDLAAAEEAARDFELPEWYHGSGTTSRGVLSFTLPISLYKDGVGILVKSHLSTLLNHFRERKRTSFPKRESLSSFTMVFPDFLSTKQAADYVRETFKWHLRGTERPSRPLHENYHDLCPYCNLDVAEDAAQGCRIPEMTQAVFYATVVSEAFELGVVNWYLVEHSKSSLKGLWWYMCEAWLQIDKHALLWAQYHRQANQRGGPRPANNGEENLKSSDAPSPSSDEE